MARAIGYDPDPEYADEDDFGYGTYSFDDGTSRYGYDPDLAREVMSYSSPEAQRVQNRSGSAADARIASNDAPNVDEQRKALDDYFGVGERQDFDDLYTAPPKTEPATPAPDAKTTPDPTTKPAASTQPVDPLKQARTDIADNAGGLDPEKLSRIIGFETAGSYSPSAVNPNGVHAGLIQFSKENWPGVAKAAGKPDVSWEDMQRMSVAEQMPFVASYFKERGITKDSSLGDYYMAVAAPGLLGKSDDTVAYAKGSKAAEQNPLWDLDKDGQVTVGELKDVIPSARNRAGQFNMEADSAINGTPRPRPAAAPGMSLPSIAGMTPTQIEMTGVPLTPEQLAAKEQGINARATEMADATRQAYDPKLLAIANKRVALEQQARDKAAAAEKARVENEKLKVESRKAIDDEVAKPIQKVDSKRFIKNMSTGDKVLGAIGIMMSGIGSGWAAALRGKTAGPNQALQILLQAIDDDIEAQRDEIRQGEANKNNRIAAWTRKLGDAEMGERAAQAEADRAAAMQLEAHDLSEEQADVQAQRDLAVQTLLTRAQENIAALGDMEANRRRVVYQSATPKAMTYKEQLEEQRAKRALEGATGGDAPEIAKVGTEDESEEARATLADEFDPESTTHKGQMTALGKEMSQVSKLEENLATLETAYGVTADESGNYPVYGENKGKYATNATGPWYNVADALDPDEPRERTLKDAWLQVETGTREGWKTEPNGEVKQVELSGIDKAKRDEDVPDKLKALRLEIARRKTAIMSSTDAPVRAAWKVQNDYPLTGQDGGSRPTTEVPLDDDDDGLTDYQRSAPYRRPAGGF